MLDTYIQTKGVAQTIFRKNNSNEVHQMQWDADYDGEKANVSIDMNENNGKYVKHIEMEVDNEDLKELLTIPSVNVPLHKRLTKDFQYARPKTKTMKSIHSKKRTPEIEQKQKQEPFAFLTKKETPFLTHLSSPVQNEEFVVVENTPTPKRHNKKSRHKRRRTYKLRRMTKKKNKLG
jgi:hypothetical protein